MPFIVATYVYASSQGQRTHSARTKRRTAFNESQIANHIVLEKIKFNLGLEQGGGRGERRSGMGLKTINIGMVLYY